MKEEEVVFDFGYIDEYLDKILSKIKTHGTISIFNGFENKVIFIEKDEEDFRYYYMISNNDKIEIDYEDIIEDFLNMFKTSIGKMTLIYRIYVGMYNSNTSGEFRELWGDILYIDVDTFKLNSENIKAEQLSTIVVNLQLTEEEIKVFGKPEDYIFKDEYNNIIMGLDLV
jgi:hypothetical protein